MEKKHEGLRIEDIERLIKEAKNTRDLSEYQIILTKKVNTLKRKIQESDDPKKIEGYKSTIELANELYQSAERKSEQVKSFYKQFHDAAQKILSNELYDEIYKVASNIIKEIGD